MAGLYADKFSRNNPRITQSPGTPSAKLLDGIDHLLLVVPDSAPKATWRDLPEGARLEALLKRRVKSATPAVSTRLPNKRQTAVHLATANPADDAFARLTFARRLAAAATREQPGTVGVWVAGCGDDDARRLTEDLLAALLAAAFPLPTFRKESPPEPIRSVKVLGLDGRIDLARINAEADGNNLARWLTSMPPNKLDAIEYVTVLQEIAAEHGWQMKRYGTKELAKKGAGAFLAVAQGNQDDSACIVRLRYRRGKATSAPDLSLVGKGIVFDTGGNNLKPFNAMLDMHIDMGGSAVAVGTLLAISQLKLDIGVDCWLAITENRIGPTAYKSQDVVTAANGKTIQAVHTDAEGRMALADTLVFACADKPKALIDYATLTGACITAVTTRYSGVFTNNPDLQPVLKRTGIDSGERVWPFPFGKEFLEDLKSTTADIQQCSPAGVGDHILAASFLNEFVDAGINWVHIDLSSAMRKGGLAHIPTDITGFGVRFSIDLLVDKALLERPAAG